MIVLLGASVLLLFLGFRQFIINHKRIADGIVVEAKVIRIVKYPRQRGGPYHSPVVEFMTRKGETITAEPENSPARSGFTVGEEFDVIYQPDNPASVTTTDGPKLRRPHRFHRSRGCSAGSCDFHVVAMYSVPAGMDSNRRCDDADTLRVKMFYKFELLDNSSTLLNLLCKGNKKGIFFTL